MNSLQNGNYITQKRFATEIFIQNCSDFAKKNKKNIQFTFLNITTTFRISIYKLKEINQNPV